MNQRPELTASLLALGLASCLHPSPVALAFSIEPWEPRGSGRNDRRLTGSSGACLWDFLSRSRFGFSLSTGSGGRCDERPRA